MTGDDRERTILETLERLLGERPLHEISIDDLARGAGISRPTFYFYFPSKEAVLLTLLDRLVEEARAGGAGDALERLEDDPAEPPAPGDHRGLRDLPVTPGGDARGCRRARHQRRGAGAWAEVMEGWVQDTTAAIEAERARGAAPDGIPARDLAIALNLMNERVFLATFAGYTPAVDEERVIDALVAVWLAAIYGTA